MRVSSPLIFLAQPQAVEAFFSQVHRPWASAMSSTLFVACAIFFNDLGPNFQVNKQIWD